MKLRMKKGVHSLFGLQIDVVDLPIINWCVHYSKLFHNVQEQDALVPVFPVFLTKITEFTG